MDALDEIVIPGTSEHQLGTAFDFTDKTVGWSGASDAFATSDGGMWLATHAYRYGFILSYPEGKEDITTYQYEPWHWRYVGVDVARELHEKGVLLIESEYGI